MSKRRIRKNVWGNWRGYEGTRFVCEFGLDEWEAKDWLDRKETRRETRRERFGFKIINRTKLEADVKGFDNCEQARSELLRHEAFKNATSAIVTRDSGGQDHPENAGKYFLHLIVK